MPLICTDSPWSGTLKTRQGLGGFAVAKIRQERKHVKKGSEVDAFGWQLDATQHDIMDHWSGCHSKDHQFNTASMTFVLKHILEGTLVFFCVCEGDYA